MSAETQQAREAAKYARTEQSARGAAAGPSAGARHAQPVLEGWLPPAAEQLLARARGELRAASAAAEPAERFRRAHLAALRVGAAILEVRPARTGRHRPAAVWDLVARAAPELGAWVAYFAAGAAIRAAVEAGRDPGVTAEQADHVLSMAGLFLDLVESQPRVARAS